MLNNNYDLIYNLFTGVTPTPKPGETPAPNPVPVCVYKGVQYTQGQRWDDGCTYKCECIDASAGKYKCTKRYMH